MFALLVSLTQTRYHVEHICDYENFLADLRSDSASRTFWCYCTSCLFWIGDLTLEMIVQWHDFVTMLTFQPYL